MTAIPNPSGLDDRPLGVFDSGVGGLTVVRALRRALPQENIVYLGDTARLPYGTKGPATVVRYSRNCARYLVERGVKAIVIACNTAASAFATERLRVDFDLPVLDVIDPGARAAVNASVTGRIGVLATAGTISSGAYSRAIATHSTRAEVTGSIAPLLVPLAEEGWTEGDVPRLAVRRYLEPLAAANVDVVVLGCTHYPLFRDLIASESAALLGSHVTLVDSALATANDVSNYLDTRGMLRPKKLGAGEISFVVTDVPRSFAEMAERFLGTAIGNVELVNL